MDRQPDLALRVKHATQIAPGDGKVGPRFDGLQIASLEGAKRGPLVWQREDDSFDTQSAYNQLWDLSGMSTKARSHTSLQSVANPRGNDPNRGGSAEMFIYRQN